ncbi:FecR family protein [Bradyrhizobium sp. SZCCHNR2032]|uniref:FecR family protein n=1 Tax=Bradyrhizobium sp. SZCCHNR2032 TaxID=3057384 RepID=UPI002916EC7A|nr:FecR family protein [Bradyrhizobium sp. SZCCHNR2032]
MLGIRSLKRIVTAALIAGSTGAAWAADGEVWSVSKSSGDVWVSTQGAAQVSLGRDDVLNPGDTIRTGRNGRVLLTRGAETILIAPNSVIGLPTEAKDGMATTILQRAGSILLDVEKRNVKHFEVETPYLAAVVKGTHFSVTISANSTRVEVSRGQVEVADFKSGQIAQVLPGQTATAFANGKTGLSLSGSGALSPIEQGRPRASSIERVPVPKGGLQAPRDTAKGQIIHALNATGGSVINSAAAPLASQAGKAAGLAKPNVVRISTTIGEMKLNVHQATHGLAHGETKPGVRSASRNDTVWSDAKTRVSTPGNSSSTSASNASTSATGDASIATAVTTAVGSSSGLIGVGNGNAGNGNGGNGNGGNGNGGNGNGGNGNGNAAANNGGGNAGGSGNASNNAGGNANDNANANGNSGNNSGHGNSGAQGNGNGHASGHNKS